MGSLRLVSNTPNGGCGLTAKQHARYVLLLPALLVQATHHGVYWCMRGECDNTGNPSTMMPHPHIAPTRRTCVSPPPENASLPEQLLRHTAQALSLIV